MEPQSSPPPKKPYKNGVDHGAGHKRAVFAPRSWSFLWRAKLEMAVALGVIFGVIGVFVYLVQIPGAIVVRLLAENKLAVSGAHVVCRFPASHLEMSGYTDVFGEAKFPGLEKGRWSCTIEPPPRYFSPLLTGDADVQPRHPAILELATRRAVDGEVTVVRPPGGPRAAVGVRAVCPADATGPAQGWEARAGILDGTAIIYLPADRRCRVGLLPGAAGLLYAAPSSMELDCVRLPCSDWLQGPPGGHVTAKLVPTAEQWERARPPAVPDEPPATGSGSGHK